MLTFVVEELNLST